MLQIDPFFKKYQKVMMDVDAAETLLQLTGKMAVKRSLPEMAEQEKNKRQKLQISDVDTLESVKGMSLKSMLNSADDVTTPVRSDVLLLNTFSDAKVTNRKIIRNFWIEFFPELPNINDESFIINNDNVWHSTLDTFLQIANQKHLKQLIIVFILSKIRSHISDVTQIPWKQMAECGISGWPEDLEIENVWGMSFSKIHLLVAKLDSMELSSRFVEDFEKKRSKSSHYQNLQKTICYHLRNTLTKQLGIFISNIPWRDLKREDFINWPDEVPVVYPVSLTIPQKLKLNEHVLDIKLTDEAVERVKVNMSSEIHVLRKEIISTLRLKLNEQLGFQVANVPWKNLKSTDIQNWPEAIPLEYPNLLSSTQNKQILEHLEEMKFSQDFLSKMSDSISSNRYYQGKTSSHIAKDLREKLNFQMGSYVSGIPWKDITAEDIIGWPPGIPVKHPHNLNALEKEKIIENISEMRFSDEFLQRFKSKKVCLDLRKFVSSGLRSKLAKQLGCVVAHIPWKEITLDDISGWPSDVPIKYPNLLQASQNKKIMENLTNITFTPSFVEKCKRKMKH